MLAHLLAHCFWYVQLLPLSNEKKFYEETTTTKNTATCVNVGLYTDTVSVVSVSSTPSSFYISISSLNLFLCLLLIKEFLKSPVFVCWYDEIFFFLFIQFDVFALNAMIGLKLMELHSFLFFILSSSSQNSDKRLIFFWLFIHTTVRQVFFFSLEFHLLYLVLLF